MGMGMGMDSLMGGDMMGGGSMMMGMGGRSKGHHSRHHHGDKGVNRTDANKMTAGQV